MVLLAILKLMKMTRMERRTSTSKPPRSPKDVPVTALNDAFGPGRTFNRVKLQLGDFQRIRKASGANFTDIALAVVAGALRNVLLANDGLPDRPLVAGTPISFKQDQSGIRQWGNDFSFMVTTLATNEEDPWVRLSVIKDVAAAARKAAEQASRVFDLTVEATPPWIVSPLLRIHHKQRMRHRDVANASVTVSNVRGPDLNWRLGDLEVQEAYMCGPPNNGVGSVVVLWSMGSEVFVGTISVTSSLISANMYTSELQDSMAELVAASEPKSASD